MSLQVGSPDSDNTLWVSRTVPAGTKGIKRETATDFTAYELFGPSHDICLMVSGLPFHGVGVTLDDAQRDLVAAIEETLDELEADLHTGKELSPELQRATAFARYVFHPESEVEDEEERDDPYRPAPMGVILNIEFSGDALQGARNRAMVEHVVAVLGREVQAYAEKHGGYGEVGPPHITTEQVSVSGLGAAATGSSTTTYTRYTAQALGRWHLPEEERATT